MRGMHTRTLQQICTEWDEYGWTCSEQTPVDGLTETVIYRDTVQILAAILVLDKSLQGV